MMVIDGCNGYLASVVKKNTKKEEEETKPEDVLVVRTLMMYIPKNYLSSIRFGKYLQNQTTNKNTPVSRVPYFRSTS